MTKRVKKEPTLRDDRGSALLVVVVMLAVISAMAAGFTLVLHHFLSLNARTERIHASAQLAEAGIEKAIAMLRVEPSYSGERETLLGDGAFSVVVEPLANGRRVTSTAHLLPDRAHAYWIEAEFEVAGGDVRIVGWNEGTP